VEGMIRLPALRAGLPWRGLAPRLVAMAAIEIDEIRKLSVAERIQLVADIWDSLVAEGEGEALPVTEAQRRELDERLARAEADPGAGKPWEDVKERLLGGR